MVFCLFKSPKFPRFQEAKLSAGILPAISIKLSQSRAFHVISRQNFWLKAWLLHWNSSAFSWSLWLCKISGLKLWVVVNAADVILIAMETCIAVEFCEDAGNVAVTNIAKVAKSASKFIVTWVQSSCLDKTYLFHCRNNQCVPRLWGWIESTRPFQILFFLLDRSVYIVHTKFLLKQNLQLRNFS